MDYLRLRNEIKTRRNYIWEELRDINTFMIREENLDGKIALRLINETVFKPWTRLPDTFHNRNKAQELFIVLAEQFEYGCCDECDEGRRH